jgi:hypothetical protein
VNVRLQETDGPGGDGLIRLGGVTVIVALGIHIVLNNVLKAFPPQDPTPVELRGYLAREAGTWAVVHGFRYVAFACVVLFAAGLFCRILGSGTLGGVGWGIVGLLGTALWVTNGVVTNGIEIVAFLNLDLLSERQELFWLLFRLTRVLFTAEIAGWWITILGFSVAGWRSGVLPGWLVTLGLIAAAAGLLSSVFVVSVIHGGRAAWLLDVAALTSLLWFLCTGIAMVIPRGSPIRR